MYTFNKTQKKNENLRTIKHVKSENKKTENQNQT